MPNSKRFNNDEYIPRNMRSRMEDDFDDEEYLDLFGTLDEEEDDDDDIFADLRRKPSPPVRKVPQKSNTGSSSSKAPQRQPQKKTSNQTSNPAKKNVSANQVQRSDTRTKTAQQQRPSQSKPVQVKKKKAKHPVRNFIITVICILLGVYLVAVGTVYSVIGDVNYSKVELQWEDSIGSGAPEWELQDSARIENILLLGIDGNENEGRSDTMIIVSIDRIKRQIKLTSLLRDMYVTIPGHGHNRLNAAYSFGGPSLLMQTIECNYRIKIDQYICVNFSSFEKIISEIGGVTINLTDAEAAYINKSIPGSLVGGTQRLNGAQAVYFARIRQIGTDFGRTSRQRTLLEALMNECKSMKLSQLLKLVESVSPNLETNLSRLKLSAVAVEGVSCWSNKIQECSIPVTGAYTSQTISGMSVLVPNLEKNCKVLHEFIFGKIPKSLV